MPEPREQSVEPRKPDERPVEPHETILNFEDVAERRPHNNQPREDKENSKRFTALFNRLVSELSLEAASLARESHNRLRRYQTTRIAVVFCMLAALLAIFYSNGNIGIEGIISKIAPVIMGFAILFYVVQAFFRDFEVTIACARESEKLRAAVRQATLEWEFREADTLATSSHRIINELISVGKNIDSILAAEQVTHLASVMRLLPKEPGQTIKQTISAKEP